MARAVDGDPSAFGMLYRRYHRPVYNYLFRRTGSWDDAEDLTSVVFLEAWRRRCQVTITVDTLLPWLLGIAHNVARNRHRSLRRHRAALSRFDQRGGHEDVMARAAERLDDERRLRAILPLMERLPERERAVLELVVWAQLSYEQTAEALDIPIGTVRSRLARGRRRLSKWEAELGSVRGHDFDGYPTGHPKIQESQP